jgi:hypothetical protein
MIKMKSTMKMKTRRDENTMNFRLRPCQPDHLLDFFASAAASLRNFAIVSAAGSMRLLFFGRRLVLVT